jgi:hypothetical protein
MAKSVVAVASVSSVPGADILKDPEILADFDAIRALNPTPGADEELIALLK